MARSTDFEALWPRRAAALHDWVRSGARPPIANRVSYDPRVPQTPPAALAALPERLRRDLEAEGRAALEAGRVAQLVLAGGMATRFGGGAKGVVEVFDGPRSSFLALRVAHAVRYGEGVPTALMCGVHTIDPCTEHLDRLEWLGLAAERRLSYVQPTLPRFADDGTPLPSGARASTGHGAAVLGLAGALGQSLRALGVQTVFVANLDNLGAKLDPTVVGWHLRQVVEGAALTLEAIARPPQRVGSFIAEGPQGWPVMVEDFRLDAETAARPYTHCGINSMWLELDALAGLPELDWFVVRKSVTDPQGVAYNVLQLEQLLGQVSELVPTAVLEVGGERFVPIKTRADLHAARAAGLETLA